MPDPTGALSTYGELAGLLDHLPLLLREARRQRQVSVREAGRQFDLSGATISSIENGEGCRLANAIAILRWLDKPAAEQPEGSDR